MPFGGQKSNFFLFKIDWSRFAKMLSPLEQEQQFWKNVMQTVSWNMKSIKEAVWSLHFWCIFVSWSIVNSYLASCSALAIVFAKSQNQVGGRFWVAGRNAQVRWGEIWGGFVICRLRLAGLDFVFGSDTPCHAYGKGGGSLRAFRQAYLRTTKIERWKEKNWIWNNLDEDGIIEFSMVFRRFQDMWLGAFS